MGATDRPSGSTPTIRSVARVAGVSVGTVSNVLNNPERVAADTLSRVRSAIEQTGFIRSSAARNLATRRAGGVGLVLPDMDNAIWVDIARGAQTTARIHELNLLVAMSKFSIQTLASEPGHPDDQDEYLAYFAEGRAAGLLLATMRDPRPGLTHIREHVRPVVVLNWDDPDPDWCTVLMDNEGVGTIAIDHLADLGITRAFFVSPPDTIQPIIERRRGLHERGAARGVQVIDVVAEDLWLEAGRAATSPIIGGWTPGDRFAIIGITDAIALGALEVLRDHPEIEVPRDIAVIGLDGDHQAGHSDWITLTSFQFPGQRMGEEAMRLLADELLEAPGVEHVHERVVLPAFLRPRGSTTRTPR